MTYTLALIDDLLHSAKVEPLPIETIVGNRKIRGDILRLDAIHPVLSGNKLYKLYGYLEQLSRCPSPAIVTPGGAHSNHLHAVAAAGACLGIKTIGLVRAYESQPLTPTLADCGHWGMDLVFLDRQQYRCRYDSGWQALQADRYQALWVGEGGSGYCSERAGQILARFCEGYDEVWLAVGSGTTALTLADQLSDTARLVGVNTVSDQGQRRRLWQQQMPHDRWTLLETDHWGRFAVLDKSGEALIAHCDQLGLPLDPVYGVRLLRMFLDHGSISDGARCLLIHGGGLQGRRGYGLGWPVVGHYEPAFDFPPATPA